MFPSNLNNLELIINSQPNIIFYVIVCIFVVEIFLKISLEVCHINFIIQLIS